MNKDRLSIITICRNECDSIKATIESVCSQTFLDYEYIVIDGGSTDGTAEVVRSYASRLAYWVSEPDRGIYQAMNKGLARARGEYTLFLNAGDRLLDEGVLGRVFSSPRSAEILYGDVYKEDGAGERRFCGVGHYRTTPFFLFSHTLYHAATFIRRELFDRIGPYDESYRISGDLEFFMRSLVARGASAEYFGLPVAIFDDGGISSAPGHKALRRAEDARARRLAFGSLRYLVFWTMTALYDLFLYRPRRKILHLLGKS